MTGPSDVDTDVLVVGAGPTGLTTALQAHAHGARVRVVERRPEAFRPSRAMIVHPRALESLRPLGVTEALLDRSDRAPRAELHVGRRRVRAELAEVPLGDTAFPHLTLVRQADVETVLAAALADRGVEVERGREVKDVVPDDAGVVATVAGDAGIERVRSAFVAGCDGPESLVREHARVSWKGGPYREEVVLADAELDGDLEPGMLHVAVGSLGLVFVFALGEGATWRVLATRTAEGPTDTASFGQPGRPVPPEEIQAIIVRAGLPVRISQLLWSSRIRLQHRLAGGFRRGRLFVAGDAAHTHSPAAAQGMNAGILDAVNLGWKLAFAAGRAGGPVGGSAETLLDSYELERRPVAGQVLALTHAVFFAEASRHPLPSLLRGRLLPLAAPAIPALVNRRVLMAQVVKLLSQRWVRYRDSPLSVEGDPPGHGPHAGDRFPDAKVGARDCTRLHALTASPGVHVFLDADAAPVPPALLGPRVTVHRRPDRPGRGLVAVRPDGHVGFRCGEADPAQLGAWLDLVCAR